MIYIYIIIMKIFIKKEGFDCIYNNNKTCEIRKFNKKYIFDNDIFFIYKNKSIKCKLIKFDIYENFNEMIKNIDISKVRKKITIDEYINILKKCYKKLDGKWIIIEFTHI